MVSSRSCHYDRAVSAADRLRAIATGPGALWRLVVFFCVGVTLVAAAIRYPQAFMDAERIARDNAALDHFDRQIGGGNSVYPDQRLLVEADARIPNDADFDVEVGGRREGWTDLTVPYAETYARYLLLPRRPSDGAAWILCLGCDRAQLAGADAVWENEEGDALLRREP